MPQRPDGHDDETQTVLRQRAARPAAEGATFELHVTSGVDLGVRVRIEPSDPGRLLV